MNGSADGIVVFIGGIRLSISQVGQEIQGTGMRRRYARWRTARLEILLDDDLADAGVGPYALIDHDLDPFQVFSREGRLCPVGPAVFQSAEGDARRSVGEFEMAGQDLLAAGAIENLDRSRRWPLECMRELGSPRRIRRSLPRR
jgi:hypothetical protein